jgi:hypothetical protein
MMSRFIIRSEDFTNNQQAVRCYEQATGARLNPKKSKALTIGNWTEPATALGIEFHDQVTILGVIFGTTIANAVKVAGQESYGRYVHRHEKPMPEPSV